MEPNGKYIHYIKHKKTDQVSHLRTLERFAESEDSSWVIILWYIFSSQVVWRNYNWFERNDTEIETETEIKTFKTETYAEIKNNLVI